MVRLRRDEPDLVVQAELVDQLVGALDLGVALGTARAADDQQEGVGSAERVQRPDRHVGPLQRLDPTDEQDHRHVGRADRAQPGAALVARREEGVLDAGRDDLDPTLRVAVQPAELLLLLDAADADGVGAVDQLGLGAVAPAGFRVAALGLDPGQRVERRHERDVEGVLDAVGDDAAQPVVGVDDVGAAVWRRCRRARGR